MVNWEHCEKFTFSAEKKERKKVTRRRRRRRKSDIKCTIQITKRATWEGLTCSIYKVRQVT